MADEGGRCCSDAPHRRKGCTCAPRRRAGIVRVGLPFAITSEISATQLSTVWRVRLVDLHHATPFVLRSKVLKQLAQKPLEAEGVDEGSANIGIIRLEISPYVMQITNAQTCLCQAPAEDWRFSLSLVPSVCRSAEAVAKALLGGEYGDLQADNSVE